MDMRIEYANHLGETLELGPESVYHYGKHTLFDAELAYEVKNGSVGPLTRDPAERELPVMVQGSDGEDGLAARERLRSVLAADASTGVPGSIGIGGWRLSVVPVAVERDRWWMDESYCEVLVRLLAARPVWTRAQEFSFVPDRSPAVVGTQLDFPYGFPYDYTPNPPLRSIDVDADGPCEWRLVVYGPATDPYVVVAGNRYAVEAEVPDGGILVADSRDWSITVRDVDGNETDAFAGRIRGKEGSGEYMWERVRPGISSVSWSNAFGWDLTVYAERDTPPCS